MPTVKKGQTLDSSELLSTLELETAPTAKQSTTCQLASFSEETDHSIAGQQAIPGSSSRQSQKFIQNTSHQQPQPITSSSMAGELCEFSLGDPNTALSIAKTHSVFVKPQQV